MDKIIPVTGALSPEKIIDLIRTRRNEVVKELLLENKLALRYQELFDKELSAVKHEFLKRDLKELLIMPVDLVHYAGLINQIKESKNGAFSVTDMKYFYKEIDTIFGKYSF